ncbi:MAG: hypothetical protein ACT6Q7_02650 [Blastomonas fulva]|uniref:hypothetical protein n=1 Tax=Blastomonas fulva TaxID=1550728 RepID=UPI004033C4C9
MSDTAHHTGKQVFIGDTAIADAYSEEAAAQIVAALNAPASIAAWLDREADRCRQRATARAWRVAADNIRAGLWEDQS